MKIYILSLSILAIFVFITIGKENVFTTLAIISVLFIPLTFINPSFLFNKYRNQFLFLFVITLFIGIFFSPNIKNNVTLQNSTKKNFSQPKPNKQLVKVTKVIDGDTIEIDGGYKIRYIGVDTPETVDPRRPVQCFGKEASNMNKKLVEGRTIWIEKDISETDKFGRLLRYVYVGNIFVNEFLVSGGYAKVKTFPPDIDKQKEFKDAENLARVYKKGLWADDACKTPNFFRIISNIFKF